MLLNGLFSVPVYAFPLTVIGNALVELSMNVLDWQVSREVPAIAVSGAVGTVKFEVYTAVPLTILTFDKYPVNTPVMLPLYLSAPMYVMPENVAEEVHVPSETPFR